MQNEPVASHADLPGVRAEIEKGGAPKYHKAAEAAGKLFARERIALLTRSSPTQPPAGCRPTA